MNVLDDRTYTESHEWLLTTPEGYIEVGLTDYAQDQMGDLVFVDLPDVGDEVSAGDTFAEAESVKAVAEVYSPISGTVIEVNEELLDNPAAVNEDPYTAWLVRIDATGDAVQTMEAKEYVAFCKNEH